MSIHAAHDTILLTGAAGFIGSHTAAALLARGQRVVGVDNFDPFYPRARKALNLRAIEDAARASAGAFELVEADITDAPAMRGLFERVRPAGVIHLAAKAGVRPSIDDPPGYAKANVMGTAAIFDAAARAACRRVVVASSSSVYGNCKTAPFHEELDVSEPISPYASTKRCCELLGYTHFALTKMPTAMLRFFTVFGPRQRPDLAISLFLDATGHGRPINVFGSLDTSRDYTFIDDIVAGILASYDRIDAHGYRVWNLGHSEPATLGELIATVGRVVGREPVLNRQGARAGDVERTWADLSRSSRELGFTPTTSLEEGMRRQWAWMQEHLRA